MCSLITTSDYNKFLQLCSIFQSWTVIFVVKASLIKYDLCTLPTCKRGRGKKQWVSVQKPKFISLTMAKMGWNLLWFFASHRKGSESNMIAKKKLLKPSTIENLLKQYLLGGRKEEDWDLESFLSKDTWLCLCLCGFLHLSLSRWVFLQLLWLFVSYASGFR